MKKTPLTIILFVAFVDLIGFGLIIPLQASYAKRLDASSLTFGLLVGIYAVMQLIFNPLLGRWSDRVGRRRVLMLSMAGSVISHAILGVADLASSLPLLFVARTLDGITGANYATAQAYIGDVTTSKDRARGMGLFGAAFGLGFVVGPSIGAGLAFLGGMVSGPVHGTAWPAFGAAVIVAVAFFLVWRYLPEPKHGADAVPDSSPLGFLERLGRAMTYARLRELFISVFVSTFALVLLEVTFVYLCMEKFGVKEVGAGLLFAYIGIIMVIVQGGMVGRLAKKYGETRLLTVAPFITGVGFILLSLLSGIENQSTAWFVLLFGCVWVATGNGLTGPNLNALISRQAAVGEQGLTMGLSQGVGSLARALGPVLAGYLYAKGPPLPYQAGAVLLAAIGVFLITIRSSQERALAALPETAES